MTVLATIENWRPSARFVSYLIKPMVFGVSLLPFAFYLGGAFTDALGANPVEAMIRGAGDWALIFLLITLTVTPLRRLLRLGWLVRLRRMLGLFSFFYACIHFTLYLWLDQYFDWPEIGGDILERPFITVGMLTLLILLVLAATSPKFMVRKLGRKWTTVHKTVYLAAILAVLHFWWMKESKSDVSEPLIYVLVLAALLGFRVLDWANRVRGSAAAKERRRSA